MGYFVHFKSKRDCTCPPNTYTHIYTYTHSHSLNSHTCTHTHTHTLTHSHTHTHAHTHTHTHTHTTHTSSRCARLSAAAPPLPPGIQERRGSLGLAGTPMGTPMGTPVRGPAPPQTVGRGSVYGGPGHAGVGGSGLVPGTPVTPMAASGQVIGGGVFPGQGGGMAATPASSGAGAAATPAANAAPLRLPAGARTVSIRKEGDGKLGMNVADDGDGCVVHLLCIA
jgi:hypothetical protein